MCIVCSGYVCFRHVRRMSILCSLYVHRMFIVCSSYVNCMFMICSSYVHCMFIACSLYVHRMFIVCSSYVHCMFIVCSSYVHCMFIVCSLNFSLYLLNYTSLLKPEIRSHLQVSSDGKPVQEANYKYSLVCSKSEITSLYYLNIVLFIVDSGSICYRLSCLDGAEVSASGLKIGRSPVQISPKTNFSIMIKLPVKSTGK